MSTVTMRRQTSLQQQSEWRPVPIKEDMQLQALLKAGWVIQNEGLKQISLMKDDRTMVHHRRRAK